MNKQPGKEGKTAEVRYTEAYALQREFIEAAKKYSSVMDGGITFNDPVKYKAFRDGQDSAREILSASQLAGSPGGTWIRASVGGGMPRGDDWFLCRWDDVHNEGGVKKTQYLKPHQMVNIGFIVNLEWLDESSGESPSGDQAGEAAELKKEVERLKGELKNSIPRGIAFQLVDRFYGSDYPMDRKTFDNAAQELGY